MCYNKLGEDNDTSLQGDSKALGDIMLHFIISMFEKEKQFAPFYFVDAEYDKSEQWKINDKHTINFRMLVDRIDRVNDMLRFIDYKTGSDGVKVKPISKLFEISNTDNNGAIFQLLVYCFFYAYINNYKGITSKCKIIRYAIENDADYKATEVQYGSNGVSFKLNDEQFNSRLLGSGNLLNILASIVVADHLEVAVNRQRNAIARLQPVEHRLSMKVANGITVLDDAYNSNPQGAKMALEVLKNFAVGEGNKRIVITPGFVEMGTRQAEANKELGVTIAKSCDYAIVVNATNREAIRQGIDEGGLDADKYYLADSLNQAHTHLAQILKAGDVVLYENDLPDTFK